MEMIHNPTINESVLIIEGTENLSVLEETEKTSSLIPTQQQINCLSHFSTRASCKVI